MVDMTDLKSVEQKRSCGFDSHLWYVKFYGGVAHLARASALHAEGSRFDSYHLHQKNKYNMIEIKKWSEMTIVEQEQWRKEQTVQLEAEKLKLAEAMELANKD